RSRAPQDFGDFHQRAYLRPFVRALPEVVRYLRVLPPAVAGLSPFECGGVLDANRNRRGTPARDWCACGSREDQWKLEIRPGTARGHTAFHLAGSAVQAA